MCKSNCDLCETKVDERTLEHYNGFFLCRNCYHGYTSEELDDMLGITEPQRYEIVMVAPFYEDFRKIAESNYTSHGIESELQAYGIDAGSDGNYWDNSGKTYSLICRGTWPEILFLEDYAERRNWFVKAIFVLNEDPDQRDEMMYFIPDHTYDREITAMHDRIDLLIPEPEGEYEEEEKIVKYVYVDDDCGVQVFDREVADICPVCGCERELIETFEEV